MVDGNLIAVDFLPTEFAVEGVEVQSMFAGNQRERFIQIRAQFIRGPRFARIVSGRNQSAAEARSCVFEAANVIALPAVEGDGNGGEFFEGLFGIYSGILILALSEFVSAFHRWRGVLGNRVET